MSNTVESTLFVRIEWIRNLIRTSDSTAFVSMFVESTPSVRVNQNAGNHYFLKKLYTKLSY